MIEKVTIEITSNGWDITVEQNGTKLTEKHEATNYGATSVGSRLEDSDLDEEFLEAIDGFDAYEIMKAMRS